MAMNFEPHECVICAQSTKIDTYEDKAIHRNMAYTRFPGALRNRQFEVGVTYHCYIS